MADKETLRLVKYDIFNEEYGDMSFHFRFVRQDDDDIRIYILDQPSYAPGQKTGGHSTHRYGLGSGKPYICYEPMPQNMEDAEIIAEEWAKRTAYYIKNKKWFQKGELS
ncbi:hypothetical protein P4B35_10100 [Pontiellaceae bacterium B12227]|nr:hypothetical protein [Pontiellaceae bacterium B12227]